MKLKAAILTITSLLVLSLLAACSAESAPTSTPALPEEQDAVIGATEPGLPIILPTYTVPQPANINPGKIIGTVYISNHDKYFHRDGCSNLTTNVTSISRQSAQIQGYTACPVCNP
jgi:hypothetical protein